MRSARQFSKVPAETRPRYRAATSSVVSSIEARSFVELRAPQALHPAFSFSFSDKPSPAMKRTIHQ